MKQPAFNTIVVLFGMLAVLETQPTRADDIGTSFTYQGQLKEGGLPANGTYDIEVSLHDGATAGMMVAGSIVFDGGNGNMDAVEVVNGLFSIELDFGDIYDGTALWLEVSVRPHADGSYTTLSPRQALTATPFALYALDAPVDTTLWSTSGANLYNSDFGNVAIGTSTFDSNRLIVKQSSSSSGRGMRIINGNSTKSLQTWVGLSGAVIDAEGTTNLQLRAGGVDRLFIDNATGSVGMGTILPEAPLHVREGSAGSVTANSRSTAVFERSSTNYVSILSPSNTQRGILFGDPGHASDGGIIYNSTTTPDGFQLRTGGNVTRMVIENDGKVGIGTTNPDVKLHIKGGSDVTPSGGGYLVLGSLGGTSISIDTNEIMARNNGNTSKLYLNNEGGDIVFGGTIDINYSIVTNSSSGSSSTASCPAGTRVIGGGCDAGSDTIQHSKPISGGTAWSCRWNGTNGSVFAICANVK